MNDQINKLVARAGGERYTGFAGSPNTVKFTQDQLESFVKMIVQECIILADDFEQYDPINRAGLVDRVKAYFGVES